MEICDIQIEKDGVEITFCNEDCEDVMTIKISKKDADSIAETMLADKAKECHDYIYGKIENFADQKYKGIKHRSTNYNTVNLGSVVSVINYLSFNRKKL